MAAVMLTLFPGHAFQEVETPTTAYSLRSRTIAARPPSASLPAVNAPCVALTPATGQPSAAEPCSAAAGDSSTATFHDMRGMLQGPIKKRFKAAAKAAQAASDNLKQAAPEGAAPNGSGSHFRAFVQQAHPPAAGPAGGSSQPAGLTTRITRKKQMSLDAAEGTAFSNMCVTMAAAGGGAQPADFSAPRPHKKANTSGLGPSPTAVAAANMQAASLHAASLQAAAAVQAKQAIQLPSLGLLWPVPVPCEAQQGSLSFSHLGVATAASSVAAGSNNRSPHGVSNQEADPEDGLEVAGGFNGPCTRRRKLSIGNTQHGSSLNHK